MVHCVNLGTWLDYCKCVIQFLFEIVHLLKLGGPRFGGPGGDVTIINAPSAARLDSLWKMAFRMCFLICDILCDCLS